MSWAQVSSGEIIRIVELLPNSARRLDTRERITNLPDAPPEVQEACGYYKIVQPPKPDPSGPHFVVESIVTMMAGVPTRTWTERPMTPEEATAADADLNRRAIVTNLTTDMVAMQELINATNATINANPATYLKSVARMNRRVARYILNQFEGAA